MLASICGGPVLAAGDPPLPDLAPVLDLGSVPYLDDAGREHYADFLLMNLPRAFAVAPDGTFGWFRGSGGMEATRAGALKSCADKGGVGCAVYAEDLRVVWPGRAAGDLAPVPGALIQTGDYALVPDPRYFWHGPLAARGVYVWGHGKASGATDLRGLQPQAHVRAFNNAGFDIVRFDREPSNDYTGSAEGWLRDGLRILRRQGWRKLVVGGQSRGAWNSLEMLSEPGLADAVIAISPANFGGDTGSDNAADLYRITHSAAAPAARVAVVQFTGDIYVTDLDRRAGQLRDGLQPRVGGFLLIDQPPGISGHGGGNNPAFALHYANCLLHFVIDPSPPTPCPGQSYKPK